MNTLAENAEHAQTGPHADEQPRKPKRRARPAPWTEPWRLLWLAAALGLSVWLIVHMPGKSAPALQKLLTRASQLSDLFGMVGVAAFLGGIMEQRRWHLVLSHILGCLAKFARLPAVVGLAMPTALVSNPAANSLLVSSHEDGTLDRSALIAGGMVNSYLAYVSHSLRVMYPVVGAVGMAGMYYFGAQFGSGLLVVLGVMLWHRLCTPDVPQESFALPEGSPPLPSWPDACGKAFVRAASLLFRMLCVTLPVLLVMEWLIKSGAFNFWEKLLPEEMARFFSPEIVSVMLAQFGGLVQSATVAANFRDHGLLDTSQIVLAMLAGSALGNPFRALRRNLPTALGIFPPSVAFIIVLGMQLSRMVTTITLICIIIMFFHA